jgi:CubicO group peptidase (beta-lactamase class C family)
MRVWVSIALLATGCAARTDKLGLPADAPANIGLSPAALARITPALQAYVDSGKLAGIVAVVARHGRIGYAQAIGQMDVEQHIPMRTDAVFRIYSMTKPVVAAGALKLVEQGKLSLDDPVSKYIPAFANVKVYVSGPADQPVLREPDAPMTVKHLLTHTAGLVYGLKDTPVDTLLLRAQLYNPASTLAQFSDSIAKLPLVFSPGTAWNYSAAIDVVGRVLEVASGQSLDRFLEASIFKPLKMRDTGFRIRSKLRSRIPALYSRGADGLVRTQGGPLSEMFSPHARFFWASGGLLSTPSDYLRFAQMLLNGGELDGVRVLTRESVALITRNHLPPELTPLEGSQVIDGGYGQGLAGIVLVDSTKAQLPGSPGIYRWSGYVGTYFWIDPRADLIAMVWTQFSPGRTYPLEQDFQRLVYAALVK